MISLSKGFVLTLVTYSTLLQFCVNLQGDTTRKVVILQTTDIHGNVSTNNKTAGWPRVASIIKQQRQEVGNDKCLLIDCGDTIQGSYTAMASKGELAAAMLNYLKYDVWIIGNHDFDFGVKALLAHVKRTKADTLAANLHPLKPRTGTTFPSWKLYTRNGVNIAVIGTAYPFPDRYLLGKEFEAVGTISLEKAIDQVMPEIMKKKPDLIILAGHNGLVGDMGRAGNDFFTVARKYPQIDIILGGHIHEANPGQAVFNCWYGLSQSHAGGVLRIVAEIDTDKHVVKKITSQLLPVSADTPVDKGAVQVLKPYYRKMHETSWDVIGKNGHELTPLTEGWHCPINEFLGAAIAEATGSQLAFHGTTVAESTLPAGDISRYSLFRIVPYQDKVATLALTRREFAEVLREQIEQYAEGRFQSPWGCHISGDYPYTITFANGTTWKKNDDVRRSVAFSTYVLAGAGGRFPKLKALAAKPECKLSIRTETIRDAADSYVKKHSPLNIKVVEWLRESR